MTRKGLHPCYGDPAWTYSDVERALQSWLKADGTLIAQVTTAMDAAFQDAARFEHSLLVGPPGLGKANLPPSSPRSWPPTFTRFLGQAITNIADLNALLLGAKDKDVIHIDECHELQRKYQTALYLALDKGTIFVSGRRSPQGIPIANFTLLSEHD